MRLLHAGVDTSVIALWLGHEQVETTQIYLHADLPSKSAHSRGRPRAYQPPVVTSRPTHFWRFLRRCDYAKVDAERAAARRAFVSLIGIIRRSAFHARYYWLLLAEGHLTRRPFGAMLDPIWALPAPAG